MPNSLINFISDCPENHVYFRGYCYFPSFLDHPNTLYNIERCDDCNWNYMEAKEYCQGLSKCNEWSYDLISLQSEEEYSFMLHYNWSTLYDKWKESFSIWTGLNNLNEDVEWHWSDGSSFQYTNYENEGISSLPWTQGEPNNQRVRKN